MDLYEAIEETQTAAANVIEEMTQIQPEECGLDNRAGYRLWINEDAIAVRRGNDNALQYYGGFEYVDKSNRVELGDYVFYLREEERINDHIEMWEDKQD